MERFLVGAGKCGFPVPHGFNGLAPLKYRRFLVPDWFLPFTAKTNYKHRFQLIGEIMAESLKDMSIGDVGRVLGFDRIGKAYRKRLLSMGLTPGTEFSVVRYAPMGDPVEIKVRGFSLSLRKEEASTLLVERL